MKKIIKLIKNNLLGFILGTIIAGTTVYAATIAGTQVSFDKTGISNATATTVQGAISELYDIADTTVTGIQSQLSTCNSSLSEKTSKLDEFENGNKTYAYWNDNFSNTNYSSSTAPSTVYPYYTNLITGDLKGFIRTTYTNGSVSGHELCISLNNRVFCLNGSYWNDHKGNGSTTNVKNALSADIKNALEITFSCSNTAFEVYCSYNNNIVKVVSPNGSSTAHTVYNPASFEQCGIKFDGTAFCNQ